MAYWEDRANERMAGYHKAADYTIFRINNSYDQAMRQIQQDYNDLVNKYAKDGKLTPVEAKKILNAPITTKEYRELQALYNTVNDKAAKRQILNRLNAPAYQARLTWLDLLKQQAYYRYKLTALDEIEMSGNYYKQVIEDSYYKNLFDVQKGAGVGKSFSAISDDVIDSIFLNPWSGKHFSERVWHNTNAVASSVSEIISNGFITGKSNQKMALELSRIMGNGKFACERLIRTETTYMANQGELQSYRELGIERLIFVATLDSRTSDQCRRNDGKTIEVNKVVTGQNYPPLHAFCRSTTIMATEEIKNMKRRAKEDHREAYYVPADMTYNEWREKLVEKSAPKRYNKDNSQPFLLQRLDYIINGKREFIPKNTIFDSIPKVIAGNGTDIDIRVEDDLILKYGGEKSEWSKKVAKIISDKYEFDIHWYELKGKQYEVKLKSRKDIKK